MILLFILLRIGQIEAFESPILLSVDQPAEISSPHPNREKTDFLASRMSPVCLMNEVPRGRAGNPEIASRLYLEYLRLNCLFPFDRDCRVFLA